MTKITLLKKYRQTETLTLTTVDSLAKALIDGTYRKEVKALRGAYPMLGQMKYEDGSLMGDSIFLRGLPRVCFASAMVHRQQQRQCHH